MKKRFFALIILIIIVVVLGVYLSLNYENSKTKDEIKYIPSEEVINIDDLDESIKNTISDEITLSDFNSNSEDDSNISIKERKINLFFIPFFNSTEKDMEKQRNKVVELEETLLRVMPFNEYPESFNFYFLEMEINFSCEMGSESCLGKERLSPALQNYYNFSSEEIHQVIFFRRDLPTGGGRDSQDYYGYGEIGFFIDHDGIILTHELGHSFAGFGDEYFVGDTRSSTGTPGPTSSLDTEGCPKWCSGNLVNPIGYTYYAGWKECVLSKELNLNPSGMYIIKDPERWKTDWNSCWNEWAGKYYNNFNSENFINECHYSPIGSTPGILIIDSIGEVEKEFDCIDAVRLEDLDLGTGCMENSGCYFTALGVNQFRQLKGSIMRGHYPENPEDAEFGPYSEQRIRDIIDSFIS